MIVPTFNEEPTIYDVAKSFPKEYCGASVIVVVVDGGSSDRTVEFAKNAGAEVFIQKGSGKGAAMKEAVEKSEGDIFVFIDGDGTYESGEFSQIVDPILEGRADLSVGTRFMGKMEQGAMSRFNILGNRLFNFMTNLSMHTNLTDILSGYRAIGAEAFRDLILFSEGFEIEAEITIEAISQRLRITEVPITYRRRTGSPAKLNPISDGARIMKTLFFIAMSTRPAFFFGVFAGIFFLVGAYPASLVLYEKFVFGEILHLPSVVLSAMLFISGALVLIFGLLADIVVNTRRRFEYALAKRFRK